MRQIIFLVCGLIVGAVGAVMYVKSQPPPPGTQAATIQTLERDLKTAQTRIAALEQIPGRKEAAEPTINDALRRVLDDLKAGRPVDIEDVYQASKGHMRQMAPVFGALRRHAEKKEADRLSGEYARKYDLTPDQQKQLADWLNQQAKAKQDLINTVLWDDKTRLSDVSKWMHDIRPDDGVDTFMELQLQGDTLAKFKHDQLTKKASRIQNEADSRLNRLNSIVKLDEKQQDQAFSLMVRTSRDYDPAMQMEGLDAAAPPLPTGQTREDGLKAILRPDQLKQYNDERQRRLDKQRQEMSEMGITLPKDWDFLEE